jgi:hypothetical protein
MVHRALTWIDSLDKGLNLRKIDMKLGTRNIMSLQRAISLITAAKEEEKNISYQKSNYQQQNVSYVATYLEVS